MRAPSIGAGALLLAAAIGSAAADELIVSAAASLGPAFREIGRDFEQARPGTKVVFNFAASGLLLQQIVHGAPVDLFASADQETMDRAADRSLVAGSTRVNFAANTLVLVVPSHATWVPGQLPDLTDAKFRRVATGNPASVPLGRYTKEATDAAGVTQALAPKMIFADSAPQVLAYVARGEVDAGFVYLTDARSAKDKVTIAFSVPTRSPIAYSIARVAKSGNAALADRFIGFVRAPGGREVLARHGFSPR